MWFSPQKLSIALTISTKLLMNMTNEYGEENKEKEEGKCAGGITRPFPMMFMLIPLLPLPPVLSMVIPFTSYSLIHDPIVLSILRLCRLCRKRR